jgi:hypothetical protein
MKRNWDLIREIMLVNEEGPPADIPNAVYAFGGPHAREHLDLLVEAGFLAEDRHNTIKIGSEEVCRFKLTWQGYELLDDIRDPEIWRKTKARAKQVTSLGFNFAWELAKAEIRAKLGLP